MGLTKLGIKYWLRTGDFARHFRAAKGGILAFVGLFTAACSTPVPQYAQQQPVEVILSIEGETEELTTEATNVRELLADADVSLGDSDLIDPPLFTPLEDGLEISIVRVSESIEVIEQTIPFQRRTVRNESMNAEDPPIIVQSGRPGLQEITVRIIYHDGLEFSRQQTQLTLIEPAQDEIVMIGVGLSPGSVEFPGQLAFISGGNSVIIRGSSSSPQQINTGGDLDHRVFTLSPTGSHLLYTRVSTETEKFNSLWVVSTEVGAEPQPLNVDNILWADWNPDRIDKPQIAFTTGISTDLLPGWEANNDLWFGDVPLIPGGKFRPEKVIEAYPATYGWWGGNYVWSPTGRYIAYSHADEVGIIDTQAEDEDMSRIRLHSFAEFNTRADWVWIPSISWSPDGQFLTFNQHASEDPDVANFDTWVINVESGLATRFFEGTGIWGHPYWSPSMPPTGNKEEQLSQIAFLRASNPLDSLRSTYTLWIMDRDGSNAEQLYPASGENSRFPREQSFMTWGPTAEVIAFVYDNNLYLFNVISQEARQLTNDDNIISNPTWAPYGRATLDQIDEPVETAEPVPEPPVRGSSPVE